MKALLSIAILVALAGTSSADGIYARFGVGPGYALGNLFSTTDSASHGADVSTELSIGWHVRPNLVIGGGTFPMVSPGPTYDGMDAGGQHVSATGPFADYYLKARDGFHVQGALLFTLGYLDGRGGNIGAGYGAMVGAGYDHRVSAKWSIGGLARAVAYRLYGVADSIRVVSPSLLLTATYR